MKGRPSGSSNACRFAQYIIRRLRIIIVCHTSATGYSRSGHYGLRNLFVINRIFFLCDPPGDRRIPILGGAVSVIWSDNFQSLSCTVIITSHRHGKGKSSASGWNPQETCPKGTGPSEAIPKKRNRRAKTKVRPKTSTEDIHPPVKPAPIQPDPLDTMGLARQLPPELLVCTALFGKNRRCD